MIREKVSALNTFTSQRARTHVRPYSTPFLCEKAGTESADIRSGHSLADIQQAIVSARIKTMKLYGTREIDNRDSEQVYYYMEARIDARATHSGA
jgi:hypothetical protein